MSRLRRPAVLLVKPRVVQASPGSGERVPTASAWEPPARGWGSPLPKPPVPCGKQVAHTLNVSPDGVGACGIPSQVTVFSSASVFAARAPPMCLLLR